MSRYLLYTVFRYVGRDNCVFSDRCPYGGGTANPTLISTPNPTPTLMAALASFGRLEIDIGCLEPT